MRTLEELDLLTACYNGDVERVLYLLDRGVNPNLTLNEYPEVWWGDFQYAIPIGLAAVPYIENHLQILKILLDAGVDIDTRILLAGRGAGFTTALGKTLSTKLLNSNQGEIQRQMIELYLARGAQLSLVNDRIILRFLVSAYTSSAALELLLNAGLDVNKVINSCSLLVHLVRESECSLPGDERTAKIKLLHSRGAVLISPRNEYIQNALEHTHSHILELLVVFDNSLLTNMTLHNRVILQSPILTQMLIDRGDDLNVRNAIGYTPLMFATFLNEPESAFILMEAGADLDVSIYDGKTAMHLAVDPVKPLSENLPPIYLRTSMYVLHELFSRGATLQLDNMKRTPLMCYSGEKPQDYDYIKCIIAEFAHFEAEYFNFDVKTYVLMLEDLYKSGDISPFKKYDDGTNYTTIPAKHNLPRHELVNRAKKRLMCALECNNLTATRVILSRYPEIDLNKITNADGRSPLSVVVRCSGELIIDTSPLLNFLLSKNLDVNRYDDNPEQSFPLMACFELRQRYTEVNLVRLLLENGADCNLRDSQGNTALYYAVIRIQKRGSRCSELTLQAVEMLLEHAADPDILSIDGFKPIDHLSSSSKKVRDLFAKYQPPRNNLIDTALYYACSMRNIDLLTIEL